MATRRRQAIGAGSRVVRAVSIFVVVAALAAGLAASRGPGRVLAADFAAGDSVVVDTDFLNVRAGGSLSAAVITVLPGGTGSTVTAGPEAADGYDWYQVRTGDGTTGWVAGAYLAFAGSWAPFAVGDPAVVDTAWLNCRSGPGLSAGVIYVMEGGTEVTILDGPSAADGYAWYEVETRDGRLGWVAGAYLAAATGGGFAVGDPVRVAGGPLNLRAEPGLMATVLRVMADNEALLIRGGPVAADGYTWYRVWNYGGEGWAAGKFLRLDPNGFPPEEGR